MRGQKRSCASCHLVPQVLCVVASGHRAGPRECWPALWSLCLSSLSCWLRLCNRKDSLEEASSPSSAATCLRNLGPGVQASCQSCLHHRTACSLLRSAQKLLVAVPAERRRPPQTSESHWLWLADKVARVTPPRPIISGHARGRLPGGYRLQLEHRAGLKALSTVPGQTSVFFICRIGIVRILPWEWRLSPQYLGGRARLALAAQPA